MVSKVEIDMTPKVNILLASIMRKLKKGSNRRIPTEIYEPQGDFTDLTYAPKTLKITKSKVNNSTNSIKIMELISHVSLMICITSSIEAFLIKNDFLQCIPSVDGWTHFTSQTQKIYLCSHF